MTTSVLPCEKRSRKPISKKTRFLVLERDGFRCCYCGSSPDATELHVDHVFPHSRGGHNSLKNFLTACRDCNLGKSDRVLKPGLDEMRIAGEIASALAGRSVSKSDIIRCFRIVAAGFGRLHDLGEFIAVAHLDEDLLELETSMWEQRRGSH